jgi:ATP-dependent phosphofructokinase / diphosphate-dependent phosphofructokinase
MHLGILTGGGDVPGLNPCIKAIVSNAHDLGWKTTGFLRGWAGPLNINPQDASTLAHNTRRLDPNSVRGIDRTGGTILRTSRTNPGKVRIADLPTFLSDKAAAAIDGKADCTDHVLNVFESMGIDALIAIGGDDTLSYAARLHNEGMKVLACPKTMDNDVFGTDYCTGFGTAVSRSVELIDALRSPAASHERIAIIELFGRDSGETALISGHLAAADRTLISEVPVDVDKLAELIMIDKAENPENYAILVVSEGASITGKVTVEAGEEDAFGHRKLGGIGQHVGEALKQRTGESLINQSLAYLMRAGPPSALDRMVATAYGTMAIQTLEEGKSGLMMALRNGNYETVPVDISIQGEKRVDVPELYDPHEYRSIIRNVRTKPMFLY